MTRGSTGSQSGAFGFFLRSHITADLQSQLVLSISLTDFVVKVGSTPRTVKVKGVSTKLAFLQLTSCKGSLPVKATAQFKDSATGAVTPVTSTSTAKC